MEPPALRLRRRGLIELRKRGAFMGWLYGGYVTGWYCVFGLGLAHWLSYEIAHDASWGQLAFGVFGYFLVIPALAFGLMKPVVNAIPAASVAAVRNGFERRALSRTFAFAVGLFGSVVAVITCTVIYLLAGVADISTEALGETGVGVAIVSIMMLVLAVIAVCPWLGTRVLLARCQAPGSVARSRVLLVLAAATVAWAGLVGWLGYRLVNATRSTAVELTVAQLPESDEPLLQWLRSQPGIRAASVSRDGGIVTVDFAVSASRTSSHGRFLNEVFIETESDGVKHHISLTQAASDFGYGALQNANFGKPRTHW
jgi:MFS family permease